MLGIKQRAIPLTSRSQPSTITFGEEQKSCFPSIMNMRTHKHKAECHSLNLHTISRIINVPQYLSSPSPDTLPLPATQNALLRLPPRRLPAPLPLLRTPLSDPHNPHLPPRLAHVLIHVLAPLPPAPLSKHPNHRSGPPGFRQIRIQRRKIPRNHL